MLRGMRYLLAVGSNLRPARHVPWLLSEVSAHGSLLMVSPFFRSQAQYMRSRHLFWNGVLLVDVPFPPRECKDRLCRWEERSGRDRSHPRCSLRDRTLDVDILWNEQEGWCESPQDVFQCAYLAHPLRALLRYPSRLPRGISLADASCWRWRRIGERYVVVRFRFSGSLLGGRTISLAAPPSPI